MPRASRPRLIALFSTLVAAGALAVAVYHVSRIAPIGTAYAAKILCSGVFVSGRDAQPVIDQDVMADVHPLLRFVSPTVDRARRRASARFLGLALREAQYRPGLGCALALGKAPEELAQARGAPAATALAEPWPAGPPEPGVDAAQLRGAVDAAFTEAHAGGFRRTRAVVVVHHGRIVAERYAPGFGPETPQIGWSMTKTVTAALIGVLVREGKLSLHSDRLLPQWRAAGDARSAITLDQLLRMTTGLAFDETYGDPLSDVTRMLLETGDGSAFAADKPLEAAPGTRWRYSSGTSYLLSRVLHDAWPEDTVGRARKALLDRIGMRSAALESDAAGVPVGAAFMYASARDWARFGQFLLQDGVWNGERILPEGWVGYMSTATPQAPRKDFGAHLWVRVPPPFDSATPVELPSDAVHMAGHEGQFVSVIPSRGLVVVRLGLSRPEQVWNQEAFLASVAAAFPAPRSAMLSRTAAAH
jgi:CubicO group peptidase (beta-lactamase class C family)